MIGRKTRQDVRLDAQTIERAHAAVPMCGDGATVSDVYRIAIARGLAWIEAHGPAAEVPTGPVTVKRAPLAKAGKGGGR